MLVYKNLPCLALCKEREGVKPLPMQDVDFSHLTFKTLRGEQGRGFRATATGEEYYDDGEVTLSTKRKDNRDRSRWLAYVLIPCCFCGFLIFAVIGTTSVLTTLDEKDHAASLIGSRMYPSPPKPPPQTRRGASISSWRIPI